MSSTPDIATENGSNSRKAGLNYPQVEAFFRGQSNGAYSFSTRPIKHSDVVFEQRVKLSCFYCDKYNKSWHCPPNIPDIDYAKLLEEYDHLLLVYTKPQFKDESLEEGNTENDLLPDFAEVRAKSSLTLHKVLLKAERFCWDNNTMPVASFVAGSCRLCKNGCNSERCINPGAARISLEATGINVAKTAGNAGIELIKWPPKNYLVRMGMLCW